jgi:hypothetical protein
MGIGCVTLAAWHVVQSLHQAATSFASCGQTYLLPMSRLVARMPGCASLWIVVNTGRRHFSGTSGLKTPLEVSTHIWTPPKSTCTAFKAAENGALQQSAQSF